MRGASVDRASLARMPDMARNGLKLLRLMFGPRVGMFLLLVWRKEPLAEGRTSIREAWDQSGDSSTSGR